MNNLHRAQIFLMISGSDSAEARIDELLHEFVARRSAGECLSVSTFATEHSDFQEKLQELLPIFLALEDAAKGDEDQPLHGLPETLGEYRLGRLIGRGGMGLVFEAHHEPLDRRVALKLLSPWRAEALHARERFLNEARAIASLQHEHLIPVFDVGSIDGYDYFAMQLVDGLNGRDIVSQMRNPADEDTDSIRLPVSHTAEHWRFAARVCMQSARALHHAHNEGVVHRDVKPSNILVDPDGKAWVSDFGLAKKPNSELTRTGVAMGTLRYMAPEQFRGEQVDGRADVYGLGVALFELLTLEESTVPSTDRLVAKDGPPFCAEKVLEDVPAPLRKVVLRATMPSPHRRYPNALEAAQDLENYLNDQPIRATGPTRRERAAWHLSKHHTRWLAALISLMLFVIVLGGFHVRNVMDKDFVLVNGSKLYPNSLDREVATWVIQAGGFVRIFDGYQQPQIHRVEELPDRLFNVTTIEFWDYDGLNEAKVADFTRLKRLHELILYNCKFNEDYVEQLTELQLISLQLNECDISDASLKDIAKISQLNWLGLRENDLSDEGVKSLKPLLNLSEINLSGNPRLTNRCLRPLTGKPALALVDLRGTQVDADAAEAFQRVIQHSDLSSRVLHGEMAEELTTIHGNKLYAGPDREIASWVLRHGGTVTLLERKARLVVADEESLPAGVFNVTGISLIECDALTHEQLRRFAALPRLEELSLRGCSFEHAWLQSVAESELLISLELRDCGLTDAFVKEIGRMQHITSLKLPMNDFTDDGIQSVAALPMLTELDLSGNAQIGEGVFEVLEPAMSTLQRIDVRGTRVTTAAAAELQRRLRKVDSKTSVLAGTVPIE